MADKPLGRVYFALSRETSGDAGRAKDDPNGTFSCRANVARFLDIENKAFTGTIYGKEREYKNPRILTLADGTKLEKGIENTDGKNAGEPIALRYVIGNRRVIIKTGKKIRPDVPRSGYHTISFAFPAWATIRVIAEALGEIIPLGKLKASPTASDIFPSFRIQGGGNYGIMLPSAAISSPLASTSVTTLKTKIKAQGGDIQEGVAP